MAQGDTIADGDRSSVAAGSTATWDVRPASGNHVIVKTIGFGLNDTHFSGGAYHRDYVNGVTLRKNGHGALAKVTSNHTRVSGDYPINNDMGVRVSLSNSNCSSVTAAWSLSGVQQK